MIRRTGHFNRPSVFTHIEKLKGRIRDEGGEHAQAIIDVLTQLQEDVQNWAYTKRFKRAYGSLILRELEGTRK